MTRARPRVRLIDVRPADALADRNSIDRFREPARVKARIAISPDGTRVYFSAAKGGVLQLYVRSLDSDVAEPIPGTEGEIHPFLSPDGEWLGFHANGAVRKLRLPDGEVVEVFRTPGIISASWTADGHILVSRVQGIFEVPDAGGRAAPLALPDAEAGEIAPVFPERLPDGSLLYTSPRGANMAGWKIMLREGQPPRPSPG